MRKALVLAVWLVGVGCAGGPKQEDLQNMEGRINASLQSEVAKLKGEIVNMDKKYATVMQLEQRTSQSLQNIDKWSNSLKRANDQMVQILEAQQKALKDQLATVEAILSDLKK